MKKRMASLVIMIMLFSVLVVALAESAAAPGQALTKETDLEKKLYEAAKKEGVLNWWSPSGEKPSRDLYAAFAKRYPGIDLNYYQGHTGVRENKYFAEHRAGKASVDTMYVESYEMFKKEGVTSDLSNIIKDAGFPLDCVAKDFHGAGVQFSVYGVAYNADLLSPKDVPKSWEDLLDPSNCPPYNP